MSAAPIRAWRWGAAAAALTALSAAAQTRVPAVAFLYPAGGRQGSTFTMVVGGRQFPEKVEAHFSGTGVTGRVVAHHRPPRQEQQEELQKELRDLSRRKEVSMRRPAAARRDTAAAAPWTADDERRLGELIETMALLARSREAPAFGERIEVEVTIAPDAAAGRRDFRLAVPGGLSRPMVFEIGELPEAAEPPLSAATVMVAVGGQRVAPWRRFLPPDDGSARRAPELPAVLNGQVGPGERDAWRLDLQAGQRLVVAVSARELLPYIADAVPGWLDAVVTLYDPDGRPVASADRWRFHPDPVFYHEAARDGVYTLEIRDCIFRGREDFVYRIAVGELPYVTDVHPLGGPADADVAVTLSGWNLDANSAVLPAGRAPGIHALPTGALRAHASPVLRFATDILPEVVEERGRGGDTLQSVTLPVVVNGGIERPGERDGYVFEGKAGQRIVAEILARRLGSPLDATLELLDAKGASLAFNDDHEDRGAGLVTHHADARIEATLPADGRYRVRVADIQGGAGEHHAYRLRLSAPRPDFELRLVPSGIGLRRGAAATVTAHVLRRDGFDGEIALALRDTKGFELSGARIPAGEKQVRFTIRAGRESPAGPVELAFTGTAEVGGERVTRPAVPAEDLEQAFLWRFLVPSDAFVANVAPGPAGPAGRAAPPSPTPKSVTIPAGGSVTVSISVPAGPRRPGKVRLELSDPPAGVTLERTVEHEGRIEAVFAAASDTRAGLKGNLILNAFLERTDPPPAPEATPGATPAPAAPPRPAGEARRVAIGSLPAIPFEITAP